MWKRVPPMSTAMRKEIASFFKARALNMVSAAVILMAVAGCSTENMRVKQPLLSSSDGYRQTAQRSGPAPEAHAWDIAKNYNYSKGQAGFENASSFGSSNQQYAYQKPKMNSNYGSNGNFDAYMPNSDVTGSLGGVNSQSLGSINNSAPSNSWQNAAPAAASTLMRPAPRPQSSSSNAWQTGAPAQNVMGSAGAVQVQQGDTLMSISRRYNVQPADLLRANGLSNASEVQPGQMLNLPTQNWGGSASAAPSTGNVVQKLQKNLQKNDAIQSIQDGALQFQDSPKAYRPPAVKYEPWKRSSSLNRVQLVQLAENNAVMSDAAPVGFVGAIAPRPSGRPQMAEAAKPMQLAQASPSYAVHDAKGTESYAALAKQYGLSASVISHANGATPSTQIAAGQKIIVPGLNAQQMRMLQASSVSKPAKQQVAISTKAANDNDVVTGSVAQPQAAAVEAKPAAKKTAVPAPKKATAQKPAPKKAASIKTETAKDVVTKSATKAESKKSAVIAKPTPSKSTIAKMATKTVVASSATKVANDNEPLHTSSVPASEAVAKPAPTAPKVVGATSISDETASNLKFRWPVKGRVVSGFGSKLSSGQNDGVNIAVPEGTAVKAAEDGIVAYTGNELKGYGNLVLISHSDGSVTAYAHNSEILVKKGEKVSRGQSVAKAGQTGSVNQPQVHFEIRKGSKPVDPMKYLPNA